MRGTATLAIVQTRVVKDTPILLLSAAACALVAYLQRFDAADARLAGCLVFGTLIGVAVALLQRGAGRFRELELCEQSAPLYGRELARATALVPCIVIGAALAAYWIVAGLYAPPPFTTIALSLCAACAAAAVALCASLRSGATRVLYVVMACGVPALAFLLAQTLAVVPIAVCILVGFIALRQYGEALARYNPL